jgi:hypothetical protein
MTALLEPRILDYQDITFKKGCGAVTPLLPGPASWT